jgi:septal ring factor EnvC (AmiA/AmiB activator)
MNDNVLLTHWALIAAILLAAVVLVIVAHVLFRRSAYGQLRRVRADLARALRLQQKAATRTAAAEKKLRRLGAKSETTKPRLLSEAKELHADALSLEKIANDKVLIAINHVRRIIHEEFPPARQQRMREKYLPSETGVKRPFSF